MEESNKLEDIKKLFNVLQENKKRRVDIQYQTKDLEENLKQDVAEVKDYKKADNTINLKEVKIAILKDAIAISKLKKKNALEEKFNILEEYLDDLENNKYNEDLIETYLQKIDSLDDIKLEISDTKKHYESFLDKDTITAIDKITTLIEKKYKDDKKEKIDEANGVKPKNKKNNNSNISKLIDELSNKLGVNLN